MLTDYTSLSPDAVIQLVDDAIAQGDALVRSVIETDGSRTYDNTISSLDTAHIVLSDAYGIGPYMARVHPDDAIREAGSVADEKYKKWSAALAFNRDLFEAVKAYSESDDADALRGERRRRVEFLLRDFRRAGQYLDEAGRSKLQALKNRLIELHVAFSRNLDEWEDGIDMTSEDLAGLPEEYIARLSPGTADGTFHVSVAYPDYIPFMEDARNRDLRRRLQFKFYNQAAEENIPLLDEAVQVRWDMARLLGHSSYAEFAMEIKMANPKAVDDFYASIVPGLTTKARAELAELQEMMDVDHPGESIQAWDWTFYDTQQRKRDYGFDEQTVASYFPLETVVEGMFSVTGDMFGIDFVEIEDTNAWHEDVNVYEIRERATDEPIAYYYADLFPRQGKYGHAACWSLRLGYALPDGGYRMPIAAVAANFTKPTADAPSLLKHDEALTLFHEFGHVLHNTLTEAELPQFSGAETEWDFVEAPSQIMENWMWEPEVLNRFARHYETDEPIPADLVDKLVAARDQNIGLKTLRQAMLGLYDLAMHGGDEPKNAAEAWEAVQGIGLVPPHPDTHFGAGFGHMMHDAYPAGYYGYLWSLVYGHDMFSVFEEEGVLNPDMGMRYRRAILAKGGTADGDELLRGFLGREPSSEAFLAKIGLDGD